MSHAEAYKKGYASNHADCDHWFKKHGKTMNDFRKLVESFLNIQTKYLVRVTTDVLNVRKNAGTTYDIVTTVKRNEVYTIIEEKVVGNDVWGRLKSQIGWICLTYTQKL